MSAFEEVGLLPELITAVEELGWTLPTPIQAEAVPLILGGGDVLAAAETGSGKTGAFALPVLQIVHETLRARQHGGATGTTSSAKRKQVPCVMSAVDRDSDLAVSPNGLVCQSRSQQAWAGVRAKIGAISGKVYYEARVTDEGLVRVGWATRAAGLELGTDRQGFGFGGTGMKSFGKAFEPYGRSFGLNDTIGCLLDTAAHTISYTKNGEDLGVAFEVPLPLRGRALYPAVCLKNAEVALNFGGAAFAFSPPHGFVGIVSAPAAGLVAAEDDMSAAAAAGGARPPTAIILEPARDLAEQTHECVEDFKRHLRSPALSAVLCIGGVPAGPQERALAEGVDVVTGTPARIMDYIESGKLSVTGIKFFVLDEADRLLDTGNRENIMKMFARLPKGGEGAARLQTLLFSATLHSPEIRELASNICHNPVFVDLKGKDAVPETVDHVCIRVDPKEDRSWLQSEPAVPTDNVHKLDATGPHVDAPENWSEAVKRLKPRLLQRLADALKMDSCLVFVRTNFDADNLEAFLNSLGGGKAFRGKAESGKENPYSCCVLAGARSMVERRRSLQAFKEGDVRFLICTDVAARGIDIQGLPFVVNMTLPDRPEDYIHRVGRVGRADALGLAFSLVATVPEKVWYCTQKGLQPWFKPDAKNTRPNDKGGHTIWYDEPQLLEDIEKRLGRPVVPLAADMSLPPHIAERVGKGTYGGSRDTESAAELSVHLQQVQPVLATLTKLEHAAQLSFFSLQRRFGGTAATLMT